jgi:NAD+ kinase
VQVSRLLVVYKKSYFELYGYGKRKRHFAALQQRHPSALLAMQLSHEENERTLAAVRAALDALGLCYDWIYRGQLDTLAGYDLILSVGGDGTLLEVARYAGRTPVLGVNSDPSRSTAFFCAATRSTITACLEALLAGNLYQLPLARLQVAINGEVLPFLALNDVLISHVNPAAMATYTLQIDTACEGQRSSGIWIATAAGSTAAIRSAGGRVLPLQSRKRQYLVREPYRGKNTPYQLVKGIVAPDAPMEITSRMRRGRLFIDGPHLRYPLGLGDVLSVTVAPTPLHLISLGRTRQRRL